MIWTEKDIIYEDDHILVTYKPAGLAVESRRIDAMTLERQIKNRMARKGSKGQPYLAVINRIDQVVEGIVLFAKSPKAAADLSHQLQEKQMEKIYLAVTAGKSADQSGRLENYLVKEKTGNKSRLGEKTEKDAKKAVLTYQILGQDEEGNSLIKIHLETGRHHQIRLQMAAAGMPLVNDSKYGRPQADAEIKKADGEVNAEVEKADAEVSAEVKKADGEIKPAEPAVNFRFDRSRGRDGESYPALCAAELTFFHPVSRKKMHFSVSPKGKIYLNFIGLLRFREYNQNSNARKISVKSGK